jgi:hypothetical protein
MGLIGGSMNTKATVLCLVLLSATWIVAQSTGSGNAGSGAGHAGTAGQSTTPGQTTSPGNPNPASGTAAPTPGTAAPTPGTAAPTPGTASPNPGAAPKPTALHGNRRTARRRQAQPHRGRKLLGLPPRHQSNRCPTTSHQTMARMGARPRHLRSSGTQSAKFSAGSSVVLSEQLRNSCPSCRMTRTTCSTYAAEPGF